MFCKTIQEDAYLVAEPTSCSSPSTRKTLGLIPSISESSSMNWNWDWSERGRFKWARWLRSGERVFHWRAGPR